jgi:tripartite ATP-independent transporter DctP family solute receptor
MKHKIIAIVISLLLASVGCSKVGNIKHLRLAHGLAPTHPVSKAMLYLAEKMKEKSHGKVIIDVYPSQELGTERQCIELLQIGALAMTKVSASVLEEFAPEFKVFSLPYIFRNDEQKFKVLEGSIGKKLLLSLQKYRLRGLCYYDAGSRSFYTKNKPIYKPSDLIGLKIRTQESSTSVKMVNALGASATPIAWGELYTALQQGVVDGAENNPPSFYLSHHYEVCKYYSLDEHTAVPDVLLISTEVWDELTHQEQKWLHESVNESYQYEKKIWQIATQTALKAVQKAGVKIIHPDKSLFEKKVQPLIESYKSNPVIYNLIKKIEAVK